jgi:PAS domain S-box-containing protein
MDQLNGHIKHGDHICVVCDDPQDRLHAAGHYIAEGLRRNEFVMYAAEPDTLAALEGVLADAGVDVAQATRRGALNLLDTRTAYLIDGQFDPDRMYAVFENTIAVALAQGYAGCRFAGEPTWALERADLRPGLLEFEARLNGLFSTRKAAGFCVYDRSKWPAEVIRDVLRTHPVAVINDLVCDNNIYYEQTPDADLTVSAERQVEWMLSQLRELCTYQARLEVAVDAGRLGSWELDLPAGTLDCSRRHDEIFGHPDGVGQWSRNRWLDHVLPAERDQVSATLDDAATTGKVCRIECRIRRADGAVRWVEIHGRTDPSCDRDTRAQRLLGIVADITERKELEHSLRDADRRKDEFMATLAHELRNPLAPIFSVLHLMQMKHGADPDLQRMHGVLDRQVRHLSRLVDDLMDLSRITTGRVVLQRARLDLRTIATNAVESAQPGMDAARHTFSLTLPPTAVELDGDATRLAQVLLNVLSNAAKFTAPGGAISLTVETADDQAIVRVRDNGMGVTPDMIPKMFEMFVQGHRAGEHVHGGLGIGLSLSRQLVALHGGAIAAHSAGPGLGTEIAIRLPLAPAPVAAPPLAMPAAPEPGCRRVLVLDDNVDAADTLAASLVYIGHDVRTYYQGALALDDAARDMPDVAILDIGMPEMDGYEVARRLRQLSPTIKLIALTGWGQESDLRKATEAGFDVHRTKPVNLADLMAEIAAAAVQPGR